MSKSTDNTTKATSNSNPSADLQSRMQSALQALGISQVLAARELGQPRLSLSKWLKGQKRLKGWDELEAAVNKWLGEHPLPDAVEPEPEQADDLDADDLDDGPHAGDHVDTPTAIDIRNALEHARKHRDLVCIFGPPGIGKTATIHALAGEREEFRDVWLATVSPSSSGLCQALEVVGIAVGLKQTSGGARKLRETILARVKGRRGLLIIDEAQHLSMQAVEELRAIHDAGQIGLAFVGNEFSYHRFLGGAGANYAQIHSRIGLRLKLDKPSRKDVVAIAKSYDVTDPASIEVLSQVASRPGALRAVSKMLRLVSGSQVKIDALSLSAARGMIGADA